MPLDLIILQRDLSFFFLLEGVLASKVALEAVEARVLTLRFDLLPALVGDEEDTLCQILVFEVDFVLFVVGEVAIGEVLGVVDGASEGGGQVGLDA
jgi:hypothetical protein